MIRRPPRSTRTDTLFPYTTRFRSSDSCFAGNHRNLPATFLPDLSPTLDQALNLAISAVKLGQPRSSRKPAPKGPRLAYFPYLNRIRKSLQTMLVKIGKLDRPTGGSERSCVRKDRVRLGQRLKPCCQMNDTSKGGNRYPRWGSKEVANDDLTACNAHSCP